MKTITFFSQTHSRLYVEARFYYLHQNVIASLESSLASLLRKWQNMIESNQRYVQICLKGPVDEL